MNECVFNGTAEDIAAQINDLSTAQERQAANEAVQIMMARRKDLDGLRWYCRFVHQWKLEPHQIEWATMLIAGERVCIVAPPGTGKSRLIRAWCEWAIGQRRDRAIIVVGNTIKQATKTVRAIGEVVRTNREYKQVFPDVRPGIGWSEEALHVDRAGLPMGSRPEPTLAAFGIDGAYQGVHVDDIIIDDPTDQNDVNSPPTMRLQRDHVNGVLFDRLNEGGNLFAILTRWDDDDLVPTLEQIGAAIKSYPAYRDKTTPYSWDTGPFDATHPVSLLSPLHLSWAKLESKRRAKGDNLFKLTYLNQTEGAVRGERVFPLLNTDIHYVSMEGKGRGHAKVTSTRVGADWGTTVQHQSAMVVVTKNKHDEIWVRAAWMSPKASTVEMSEKLRDWKPAFNITQVHYDRSQGALEGMFRQCGVTPFKGENSVEVRIGALRTLLGEDLFFIDSDGEGTKLVWSQLASYRYDETGKVIEVADDLVDALLMALHAILEASKISGVGRPHEIIPTTKKSDDFDPDAPFDPVKELGDLDSDFGFGGGRSMKDYGV